MAFPANPLGVTTQLHVAGAWTGITADTLGRDKDAITIQRGRMSEGSTSTPTACNLSIRNTNGTYSPRNPSSPYYGLIGRNTPLRVYTGTPHLGAGGGSGTASTSHIAPSVTATGAGLLVCGWMADDPVNYTLPGGMTAGPIETDGTFSTMRTAYQSVTAGATGTRTATASTSQGYASVSAVAHGTVTVQQTLSSVSTTMDDVTLTTSASTVAGWWLVAVQGWIRGINVPMPDAPYGDDGGWILLGDSDRVDVVTVGSQSAYLHVRVWARRVNYAGAQSVIYPGVAGGSTADNHAVLYVLSGVTGWNIRATVEVPSWPQRWDVSGNDVWVPIEGQGILRRLGQGSSPLTSALRRAISGAGASVWVGQSLLPVTYWPIEDGSDATQAASGLTSGAPMLANGTVRWASVSSPGSSPLPDWSQSTGSLTGPVSGIARGTDWQVGCLVDYTGSGSWMALSVKLSGAADVKIQLTLGSAIALDGIDYLGASTSLVSAANDLSDDLPHWVHVDVFSSGGIVTYRLHVDGVFIGAGGTPGTDVIPTSVQVHARSTTGAAGLGHVGVWPATGTSAHVALIEPAIDGHNGEVAGRRIERLCREEDIAIHIVGDADDTVAMGPQAASTLLDLLRECEDADGGILYEPREALGLGYRCTSSRYNQPVTLALTYGSAGEIAPPVEPEDDDRYTRNDVTASRSNGSSARYEVTTGSMSTQDPPAGVGRYDTSVTVNVQTDAQLLDQASWRAHLGTWDEPRYPVVRANMVSLGAAGKTSLIDATAAVDVGDRLTIANPPVWLPPGAIDQHVEGYTEALNAFVWDVRLVCSPAGPWQVATVDGTARVTAEGSTLAAGITSGATTLQITSTAANGVWTTDYAVDYPLDLRVGAEQVTAGAPGQALNDNPWIAGSTAGWASSNSTITYSTTQTIHGYGSILITPTGGGSTNAGVRDAEMVTVTAGASYLAALWAYSPTGWAGGIGPAVDWYDAGSVLLSTSIPTPTAMSAGVWTPLVATVTAPALAAKASVRSRQAGSPAASDTWYATAIVLIPVSSYSTSPQTITIAARSVNGVVKAWDAGTEVNVWLPAVVAL